MPIEAYFCEHVHHEVREFRGAKRMGFFRSRSGFELFSVPMVAVGDGYTTSQYLPDPVAHCSECDKPYGWKVEEKEAEDEDDTDSV